MNGIHEDDYSAIGTQHEQVTGRINDMLIELQNHAYATGVERGKALAKQAAIEAGTISPTLCQTIHLGQPGVTVEPCLMLGPDEEEVACLLFTAPGTEVRLTWPTQTQALAVLAAATGEYCTETKTQPIVVAWANWRDDGSCDAFRSQDDALRSIYGSEKATGQLGQHRLEALIRLKDHNSVIAAKCAFIAETIRKSAAVDRSICLVGMRGSAYDTPDSKRAYTYTEQPGNLEAYKLGMATESAANASAGDWIDRGLALLKALQDAGFGVFQLGAEYTSTPLPAAREAAELVAALTRNVRALSQRPTPMCRDCADCRVDGICDNTNQDCDIGALIKRAETYLAAHQSGGAA